MLWSLIKIVIFVLLVAAAALGASYLLEMDGGVRIAFGAIEVNLTPLKAVIALLVLVAVIWLVLKLAGFLVALLRFINGDETALSRYFTRNRERKGYQALSEGMMALASGEGRLAMNKAARAERFLGRPELTTLLTAQAAEMSGDKARAEASYKKLLKDDRTRFVGIRGLMHQKLAAGDTDTALKLAERAFALKPQHEEVQDTLLRLQAGSGEWKNARGTLKAKLRHGALPRDVHKRRDAVLALSEARAVMDEDSSIEAREAAIEANKLSPDLVPAAVFAARAYIEKDQPKYATRVLKKAWEAGPHPDLAAAFAAIAPEETPAERLKRFRVLTRLHPEHRETRLLQAELLLAAEDFPEARRALGDLAAHNPDARVLTIMAAIERGEGSSDAVVRGWLARAVTAPRGPAWICENCHHVHGSWAPICDNCGAFDTLAWKETPVSEVQTQMSQQMLPLIVGLPENPAKSPLEEEIVVEPAPSPVPPREPADQPEAPEHLAGAGNGETDDVEDVEDVEDAEVVTEEETTAPVTPAGTGTKPAPHG